MKYSFKQFNEYANLPEDQRTQEQFDIIFADCLEEGVIGDIAQAVGKAVGTAAKAVGIQSDADKARAKIQALKDKKAAAKTAMDKKLAKLKSFDTKAKDLANRMDSANSAIMKDRAALMRKNAGKYSDNDFAKDLLSQKNESVLAILQSIVDGDITLAEARAPKAKPVYTIIRTKDRDGRQYKQTGTLEELIKAYSYTLEKGASWQHEKGNKKINRNPKNIKSLVDNLYNADNNAAANGYAGYSYSYEDAPAAKEEIKEGWERVNGDKTSQERIKRDRAGTPVKTSDGRTGVIDYERKLPTFSQMVPFAFEIVVKFDDGKSKTFPRDEVRVIKAKKVEEHVAEVLDNLRLEIMEKFDLTDDEENTIEGLMIEEIGQFLSEELNNF